MEQTKILKHFSKFILPFRYNTPEKALDTYFVEGRKGQPKHLFKRDSQDSFELRQGLDKMLSSDGGDTKIADVFQLNDDCRMMFGLSKRPKDGMSFYRRGDDGTEYKIFVNGVRVYLFESGVGFYEMEISYDFDDVQKMIDCNYFISEVKSDKNYFEASVEVRDGDTNIVSKQTVKSTFLEYADKILSYIKDGEGNICADTESFKYNKALMYSYVCLDKKPEDFDALMFNLRKNFKASYKYPADKPGNLNPYVKQQFENSYWGTSFNGAVNISYLVGDEKTDSFFLNEFYPKMRQTYYSLFLHVIHQRYSILKFIAAMGKLDSLNMDYGIMKQQLKEARAYQVDVANLKFRAFFKQPSMVEHINDYYLLLSRTFRIDELYKSFTNDLDNLENICAVYVSRIKERDKKFEARRKSKIEIFIAIFGGLVGLISIFENYWSLSEKIFGKTIDLFSAQILVFAILLLLPLCTLIFDIYYQAKSVHKMTKDLKDDLKDGLVEDDKERKRLKKLRDKLKKQKPDDNQF